jgi:hypothetical protein
MGARGITTSDTSITRSTSVVNTSVRHQVPERASPPSLFGGTLGIMALAFGLGVLGAYMLDVHAHTCEACGNRWRHLGAFNLGDLEAHRCQKCGQVQWWKCGWQRAEGPRSVDGALSFESQPVSSRAPSLRMEVHR